MSLMNSVFGGAYPGSQADYEEHLRQLRRVDAAQQKQQYAAQQGLGGMKQKRPRFNPNEIEAFNVPLAQLVTLWRIKHGDAWYDAEHPRPEPGKDFYTDAFDRLNKANMFEMFEGWYRLKEDA
jgi:hypothetical protein